MTKRFLYVQAYVEGTEVKFQTREFYAVDEADAAKQGRADLGTPLEPWGVLIVDISVELEWTTKQRKA